MTAEGSLPAAQGASPNPDRDPKPTTYVRYRDYVTNDLIPDFGQVRLDDLGYSHIAAFVHTQLDAGRGEVTVHRCLATLSSALGDAVRRHRLPDNPARPTVIPRPTAAERQIWTVQDASRFLRCCRATIRLSLTLSRSSSAPASARAKPLL